MRVLQLISSAGFFGAENAVSHLAAGLTEAGRGVFLGVITGRKGFNWPARKENYPVAIFDSKDKFNLSTVINIRKYCAHNGITLINSHNYKADFYGCLASLGTGIQKVATCHNWLGNDLKMGLYERLDKILLKSFDSVVAVSESLREEILASGVAGGKISVIANGIRFTAPPPDSRKRIRDELSIPAADQLVLSVGRLSGEKGHYVLLKAFSALVGKVRGIRLLLAGDGPLRKELESEAGHLGIAGLTCFAGFREDIPALLAAADIFVLPSLTEAMPLALIEAMAAGKAVVATRVGAVPEILGNNEYGLLVPPGEHNALSRALERYLTDRPLAEDKARKARKKALRENSAAAMARAYGRVYDRISRGSGWS